MALRIAYDGRFPGYARQPGGGTVEDILIEAMRPEGYVTSSWRTGSRTDRGVCAMANVAACSLERPHLLGLLPSVQSRLPEGLWLTGAAAVDEAFDPRMAAWREYAYLARSDGEDADAMRSACQAFVGRHDMTAFARMEEGRPPLRTVRSFAVEKDGPWWRFRVTGQSFLWNQVRRMVDAALQVGRGRAGVGDIEESLRTGRPHGTFGLAPAAGLVLRRVAYDPEPCWQRGAGAPWTRRLAEAAQEAQVRAELMEQLARGPDPDGST